MSIASSVKVSRISPLLRSTRPQPTSLVILGSLYSERIWTPFEARKRPALIALSSANACCVVGRLRRILCLSIRSSKIRDAAWTNSMAAAASKAWSDLPPTLSHARSTKIGRSLLPPVLKVYFTSSFASLCSKPVERSSSMRLLTRERLSSSSLWKLLISCHDLFSGTINGSYVINCIYYITLNTRRPTKPCARHCKSLQALLLV
jgi:hypothetical protein